MSNESTEVCNVTLAPRKSFDILALYKSDDDDDYFFLAHQHKATGMKIKLSKNNDHDGLSHGVKCSQEGDRIPPLKRYR